MSRGLFEQPESRQKKKPDGFETEKSHHIRLGTQHEFPSHDNHEEQLLPELIKKS